jgi:RHS repeat-associated protein
MLKIVVDIYLSPVETELYYLQSRYYSPELCRFINADDTSILLVTQGELLGANLFAYCGGNPIVRYDPTGEIWWWIIPVAVVLIGSMSGCSSQPTAYSPKYNKYYTTWTKAMMNYNCYAYAIGRTDLRMNPGYFSDSKFKLNIDTLKDYVCADLKKLGYNSKPVEKTYKPTSKETMIALRIGPSDYHFMKRMSDGSWTHKPGQTAIIKLIGNPWDYTKWYGEYYYDGKWGVNNTYYDSKIYYIVYWK